MAFLLEEEIRQWEEKYEKIREDLLTHKEGMHIDIYHRRLDIANKMECANRVFLHFAETGEVDWGALG